MLQIQTARKYLPLLQPARYKAAFGGRGSGKSRFFGGLMIELAYATPLRAVCIREVQNSIRDSVRQLLVDTIETYGVGAAFTATEAEIRGASGSTIGFRGMNDFTADNIKSLEGYDVAWVEEAQTLSDKSLTMLRPTLRKDTSEMWFSWNPRNRADPVDYFFRGQKPPKGAIIVQANHTDNPWFPKALADDMAEDRAKDAKKAAHVWDGAYEEAPEGAYYGLETGEIEAQARIREVLADPALLVHTAWDLGVDGSMTTWFFQVAAGQFRWLDYHEYEKPGLPHAATICKAKQVANGWAWGTHLWPHDGETRDIGSGVVRSDTMRGLGFPVTVLPRAVSGIADGIEASRRVLKTSWFDRERTALGFQRLKNYKRKFNKSRNVFLEEPDKDGNDHGADAFRCAAMGQNMTSNSTFKNVQADTRWVY